MNLCHCLLISPAVLTYSVDMLYVGCVRGLVRGCMIGEKRVYNGIIAWYDKNNCVPLPIVGDLGSAFEFSHKLISHSIDKT